LSRAQHHDKPASRRRRKPIDMKRVQLALGEAIEQLEFYILEPVSRGEKPDLDVLLKVAYALAQVAGSYRSITEAGAFEEELATLRKELHEATAAYGRVAGGHPSASAVDVN
jgi:hypothetical protein